MKKAVAGLAQRRLYSVTRDHQKTTKIIADCG